MAGKIGTRMPVLAKIVQYLEIAKFVHTLLSAGLKCKNGLDAVLFFIALSTVITMLAASLVLSMSNPIAAFATGFALDAAFSWLVSQSQNCQ